MGGMTIQQQQMMQAQAVAAEAYQRAMMTFSQAGSQAPSEAGGDSPATPGSRIGSTSPMPGMAGTPSAMGYGYNPMMGPMGMGMGGMGMGMGGMMGMGGWGTPGQATPQSMASPSVYAQQFAASPGPSIDQHGRQSASLDTFNQQERSASQSRQSNNGGPSQN